MDNYKRDPNSLPEPHRAPIAGPAEFLIDYPRVMGILQTLIDPDHERIRLESVFTSARSIDDSALASPRWRQQCTSLLLLSPP
jgi:hypothetical protein